MNSHTHDHTSIQQAGATTPPLNGTPFDFGEGQIYVVPPLTLRDLKRLKSDITSLQKSGSLDLSESIDACVTVIHTAMIHNYPSLTQDDLAGLLNVGNMLEVIRLTLNVPGFGAAVGTPGNATQQETGRPVTKPAFWGKK